MLIPDIQECCRLMDHHGMPANIRRHSIVVAQLADRIIQGLHDNRSVPSVADRRLVVAGALLHDIAKIQCVESRCDHAYLGAEICRENGYHEVAAIVAEHVIPTSHDPERCVHGRFTAEEIVYYADKRVRHHEVVSLPERLDYIIEHYGCNDPERHRRIRQNFQRCINLEALLFQWLDFEPEQLGNTDFSLETVL